MTVPLPKPAALIRTLSLLLLPGVACAQEVACHYEYGGEPKVLVARPVSSPYTVPAVEVGSHLKFRVVFQTQPRDLASIKLYAYAANEDGATLVHQATYPYPLPKTVGARRPYGFTGLHSAFEPALGAELQYWCEMRP
jgi:hypothetical protein